MQTDLRPQTRSYSLDEAFKYCASVTNTHYENFPVASLFLPEEKRPYIQAVYAFSRLADDMADEGNLTEAERLTRLEAWEEQLRRCYEGFAEHPVFIALSETIQRLGIPIALLQDLLTAFKRDVTQHRYPTFEDLLAYCRCSANPVGRLVLMTFGYRDEQLFTLSDNICTALQLTNFWQDVGVDLKKDRLYIPLEDMQEAGYALEDWRRGIYDRHFKELLRFEVNRTRNLFFEGVALTTSVDRDLELELKLVWLGGMSILRKIERADYHVFQRRPSLNSLNKLMILIRGVFVKDLTRLGKKERIWDRT